MRPDQFQDTPQNRDKFRDSADIYAWGQNIVHVVVKFKSNGQLGVMRKSRFDPEKHILIHQAIPTKGDTLQDKINDGSFNVDEYLEDEEDEEDEY